MKKKLNYLLLLYAVPLGIVAVMFLRPLLALWGADCVVRVSFTGLENMFHTRYTYYALDDRGAVRVPDFLAGAVLGTDVEAESRYDDTETSYWLAQLQYGKDELTDGRKPHLETSFGPDYWLTYDSWTNSTPPPGEEDLALMRRAAETLHDGDLEKWIWRGGGAVGLTSFLVVRHGDIYLLVQDDRRLLRAGADGSFRLLMDRPEGGCFDCWFFK